MGSVTKVPSFQPPIPSPPCPLPIQGPRKDLPDSLPSFWLTSRPPQWDWRASICSSVSGPFSLPRELGGKHSHVGSELLFLEALWRANPHPTGSSHISAFWLEAQWFSFPAGGDRGAAPGDSAGDSPSRVSRPNPRDRRTTHRHATHGHRPGTAIAPVLALFQMAPGRGRV